MTKVVSPRAPPRTRRWQRVKTVDSNVANPERRSSVVELLKQEFLATLGVAGAALTVLSQLEKTVPMTPLLARFLVHWQDMIDRLWRPPLDGLGLQLHPHLQSAATLSLFLCVIAIGARVSTWMRSGAAASGDTHYEFLAGSTWPSLLMLGGLVLSFMLAGPGSADAGPLVVNGSEDLGQIAFALTACAGYFIGDVIARAEFHSRLIRLAVVVAVVLALNAAALTVRG